MASVGLRISRRPLRIGWCVRQGDFSSLRIAVRLTSSLWGGRYNPIITVDDDKHAKRLIRGFRVDALFPVGADPLVSAFVQSHDPRGWFDQNQLIHEGGETYREPPHMRRISSEDDSVFRNGPTPFWEEADPLADCFLLSFGGFTDDVLGQSLETAYTANRRRRSERKANRLARYQVSIVDPAFSFFVLPDASDE
jgi:hypothetical protein